MVEMTINSGLLCFSIMISSLWFLPRADLSEANCNRIVNGMSKKTVFAIIGRNPSHYCQYRFNSDLVVRAEWSDLDKEGDEIQLVVYFDADGKVTTVRRDIVTGISMGDRWRILLSKLSY